MGSGEHSTKINISAFYFFVFFGFGGLFPLISIYLRDSIQLSGTQIGMILSIGPIVMIVAQPIWGMICDYTQRSRLVLTIAVLATGLVGLFYLFGGYYWFLFVATLLALFQSPIIPISDSLTMRTVTKNGWNYGDFRLWGAVGFALATFVMGLFSDHLGLAVIFYMFALTMLLGSIFAWRMPEEKISLAIDLRTGLRKLLSLPSFVFFLVATFLIYGPIQANNVFFSLLFQDLGGTVAGVGIGFLLAAGSEVPFSKYAGPWMKWRGPLPILFLAAAVSGLRWIFYFFEPSLTWVYASTLVQGVSVGLFIPAALQYVQELAPAEVQVTAISMYTAAGVGLGNWFFTFLGGLLIDHFNIFTTYLFFGTLTLGGVTILLGLMWVAKRRR